MSEISLIAGVSPSAVRLLGEVGVQRIDNLARQDAGSLFQRLSEADQQRRLMGGDLTPEAVRRWIEGARTVVSSPLRQGRAVPASAVKAGDLTLNLDAVPEAIIVAEPPPEWPAPASAEVPDPEVDPETDSEVDREVDPEAEAALADSDADAGAPPAGGRSTPRPTNQPARTWKQVEKEKFRDLAAYAESLPEVLAARATPRGGRDGKRPGDAAAASGGRDALPRRVRRGIPHPRPFFVLFGALVVLVTRLLFLIVLIGTPIALLPAFSGRGTEPLIIFLWIIGGWLVSCLLYLAVALRVRCRVCTNQIFFSKRCFKNVKAHRVFGFGLVGSLALHAIVFRWFRCMYCGTAIRLKFFGRAEPRARGA
jgi:hypothetical protein